MTEPPEPRRDEPSGIFADLGRRTVFRVAGAYVLVSWTLMQVAEITFPAFELPNSALRLLILVLAAGLPLAILLAWLIDVTPRGIRFGGSAEESAPGASPDAGRSIGRLAEVLLLGLCLPGLGFGALLLVFTLREPDLLDEAEPQPGFVLPIPEKSIAVLPFEDLEAGTGAEADDAAKGFFARGIHEDLLTNLGKLSDLKVISRTSVLQYADRKTSAHEIGRTLGVAHVLEGSVRRDGERVRVSAQLIRADRNEQIWADSFDAEIRDVFAVQSQIARRIAEALDAKLSPEIASSFDRVPTQIPAAYDAYLQARDVHRNLDAEDDAALERARVLYGRALELDPDFAEAWAQLAILHAQSVWFGADSSPARMRQARDALDRARSLDPELPMLALAEGIYSYYCDADYTRALVRFGAALDLSPGDAEAIFYRAMILRRTGAWPDAIAAQRRALELDPLNLAYQDELALTLALAGQLEDAHALLLRLLESDPHRIRARFYAWQIGLELHGEPGRVLDEILASDRESWGFQHYLLLETVAVLAGREEDAIRVIEGRPVPDPDSGYNDFQLANLYTSSGRADEGRVLLEKSFRKYQTVLAERPDVLAPERRNQVEALFLAKRGDFDAAIALERLNVLREPIERDVIRGSPPLALLLHLTLASGQLQPSLALLDQLEARVAYGGILSDGYYVLLHSPEYRAVRADPAFEREIAARLPAYAAQWPRD